MHTNFLADGKGHAIILLSNPRLPTYMSKKDDKSMEAKKILATVTVTAVDRSERKMIILRSKSAQDYFSYCAEVGCDWEGQLNSVPERYDNAALIYVNSMRVACCDGLKRKHSP